VPRKAARARQAQQLAVTNQAEAAETVRPVPHLRDEAARTFAIDAARLMAEDRCEDILILDLRGISPICDYFVIGTGTSDRQMRAVADHVEAMAKARNEKPFGVAGYEEGGWIVIDYVDVVIHLFAGEQRAYYNLETLWGDSPRVKWEA
jgi:ribosome-associated protein